MWRFFRQGGDAHLKTSNLIQIEASATLYLYFDPIKVGFACGEMAWDVSQTLNMAQNRQQKHEVH